MMQIMTLKFSYFNYFMFFSAVKISDVKRQLLHGAVEEEVLLG